MSISLLYFWFLLSSNQCPDQTISIGLSFHRPAKGQSGISAALGQRHSTGRAINGQHMSGCQIAHIWRDPHLGQAAGDDEHIVARRGVSYGGLYDVTIIQRLVATGCKELSPATHDA
jgi:hypothetical protein